MLNEFITIVALKYRSQQIRVLNSCRRDFKSSRFGSAHQVRVINGVYRSFADKFVVYTEGLGVERVQE